MTAREATLMTLSGIKTDVIPAGLFTWGYNYIWKTAGLKPWRLALGGRETWHAAHMSLYERHRPDLILYEGAGSGPNDPLLTGEDGENWFVTDTNGGGEYVMIKSSGTLYEKNSRHKPNDSLGEINCAVDADKLCKPFTGWGDAYLTGLSRLIGELGERSLVIPHHSPSYIVACYAFGFEPAMIAMKEDPDLFQYVMDIYQANTDLRMRQLREAGAEAVFIADGWSSADIVSPELFERFCFPSLYAILQAANDAGLKTILWDEGDIKPQLGRLSDLPLDAFTAEQPRKGAGLSITDLCGAFKGRCVLGNLDSEEMLLSGDASRIERETRRQIAEAAGNPYITFTGSPLPDDADPDCVDIIINAAKDYRKPKG